MLEPDARHCPSGQPRPSGFSRSGAPGIMDTAYTRTAEFWRKDAGVELSAAEAREAEHNVAGFFRLLGVWARESEASFGGHDGIVPGAAAVGALSGPPPAAAEVAVAPTASGGGPDQWSVEHNDSADDGRRCHQATAGGN